MHIVCKSSKCGKNRIKLQHCNKNTEMKLISKQQSFSPGLSPFAPFKLTASSARDRANSRVNANVTSMVIASVNAVRRWNTTLTGRRDGSFRRPTVVKQSAACLGISLMFYERSRLGTEVTCALHVWWTQHHHHHRKQSAPHLLMITCIGH